MKMYNSCVLETKSNLIRTRYQVPKQFFSGFETTIDAQEAVSV